MSPPARACLGGWAGDLAYAPAVIRRLVTVISWALVVGYFAAIVAGCSLMARVDLPSVEFATPSLAAGSYPLPTVRRPPLASGDYFMCAGVGLIGATLRGDPSDPSVAWLDGGGHRQDVVWPEGYRARFTPDLEILDASGTVVLRDGASIAGACVGPGDLLSLEPPFR